MPRLFFKPWVGRHYGEGGLFGQHIFILGEAHYQWKRSIQLTPQLTRDCVRAQISDAETKQFWTNIAIAFLGQRPSLRDKQRFWHAVAFSNLIQDNVGFGPRIAPTEEMWAEGRLLFRHFVARYKPDVMAVLGYRLWEHLPDEWGKKGPQLSGTLYNDTWIYPYANGTALAFPLRHPSAGFSGLVWHRVVKQALALASSAKMGVD
jgi:hypothetical protein